MSKQAKAKKAQNYTPVNDKICAQCKSFTKDTVTKFGFSQNYSVDTNLRCSIGGFAVKKMGTCDLWSPKSDHDNQPL